MAGWAAAALAAGLVMAAQPAWADDAPGGREMSTDRPDTTESPYTVEPGRWQVESTIIGYSRTARDDAGAAHDYLTVAATNLRIGLTPRLEADVVLQPYGRDEPTRGLTHQGVGDLTLRLKLNLSRPDGVHDRGDVAVGLLPFVNIPTDRSDGISDDVWGGGFLVPVDVSLGGRFSLGANAGFVVRREDRAIGYEAHTLLTTSLGCDWTKRWGTYHEVAAELNGSGGDQAYFDNGLTFRVTDNLQLDAGVNLGLTRASDRVQTFVGVSARF